MQTQASFQKCYVATVKETGYWLESGKDNIGSDLSLLRIAVKMSVALSLRQS